MDIWAFPRIVKASSAASGCMAAIFSYSTGGSKPFYPVIYLDALVVKVRDDAHVRNKAAHIAVGVDLDGIKHVLGIWVQTTEGAKFWAGVCAELANRGIKDVLIVCCDGLSGFPEAIEATWPQSTVQTCVVHLIRTGMRFVSWRDRRAVAAALKPVYQAPDAQTARAELDAFADSELGRRNPHTVAAFTSAWERFTPFLAFPPMLRRVIYTTNAIVISSPANSVLDVRHEVTGSPVLRGGHGYLQSSRKQSLRRHDARSAGHFTGLVA
jgi:putative transposase